MTSRLNQLTRVLSGRAASAAAAPASMVGKHVTSLDTPALLLDMEALEYNIKAMAKGIVHDAGKLWRPHCKAIRSPEIAQMFIDAGACGVTCAKVSQAAALVDGGIRDILIANQVVGATKITNLVALARRATICVAIDSQQNLQQLSDAATKAGVTVAVVVDIDVGMKRCGIPHQDKAAAIALCQEAVRLPSITWRGIMGYDGHAQEGTPESHAETKRVAGRLQSVVDAVEAVGLKVGVVTGAGSGNYSKAIEYGVVTECQGGGGVLYCQLYESALGPHLDPPHRSCLFLMAQVVSVASQATERRAHIPIMGGLPKVTSHKGVTVTGFNAEHTLVSLAPGSADLTLGERITMSPFYSDATVFLHRQAYGFRDAVVEKVFDLSPSLGQLQ
eukprot:gene4451-12760_t